MKQETDVIKVSKHIDIPIDVVKELHKSTFSGKDIKRRLVDTLKI